MATRKSKKLDTFEGLYKRLEEVILANSGENEFEEIFKLVVLKLWNELNDEPVELTMDKANLKLRKIDLLWGGVLSEPRLLLCEEHYQICVSILKTVSYTHLTMCVEKDENKMAFLIREHILALLGDHTVSIEEALLESFYILLELYKNQSVTPELVEEYFRCV